jgi:hypothetical protein
MHDCVSRSGADATAGHDTAIVKGLQAGVLSERGPVWLNRLAHPCG